MIALARHQMAEDSAIILSAVIMTTHPMPALARHQMAEGLKIIRAMGPHPKGLRNDSKLPPRHRKKEFQSMAMVIDTNLNYDHEIMRYRTHVLMPKILPENMMETIEATVKLSSRCPESLLFKFEMNGEAAQTSTSFGNSTST
jgi:hypothetical protein